VHFNTRFGRRIRTAAALGAALAAMAAPPTALAAPDDGGPSASYFPLPGGQMRDPNLGPAPGRTVTGTISPDGLWAVPPKSAPAAVVRTIEAANRIAGKPYRWGGGHRRFVDSGYDCSGAVSFALRGAGLVPAPLDSRAFMRWGQAGAGAWITVYANRGHAFLVVAGLRFDTSGPGSRGPRWRPVARSAAGFSARHFPGL
jgi:cell wall-associated NlpC family hydrolase